MKALEKIANQDPDIDYGRAAARGALYGSMLGGIHGGVRVSKNLPEDIRIADKYGRNPFTLGAKRGANRFVRSTGGGAALGALGGLAREGLKSLEAEAQQEV